MTKKKPTPESVDKAEESERPDPESTPMSRFKRLAGQIARGKREDTEMVRRSSDAESRAKKKR